MARQACMAASRVTPHTRQGYNRGITFTSSFFFLFFFSSRSGPLSLMTALFLCSLTCVSFSASRFRDVNRDGVVCFASPKKIKVPSQFRARYERHSRVKMACPLPYATTREGAEFSRQQVWRCVGLSRARITICRLFCHP